MKPVRRVLAAGLVAGLTGCSNLHQNLMFRPVTDRATIARDDSESGPPDLFHRPSETPTERLARYFPGLTRSEKATTPPTSEGTWRGHGNPNLRAVPRDATTDDETTTAAGRPRSRRSPSIRPVEVAARREEPGSRRVPEPLPLLAAAVVAETDPADAPRAADGLPELTPHEQALRAARVAEMTSTNHRSVRRMPPMPVVNPELAARPEASPIPRPATRDEDSQARQVRTQVEDAPVITEAKPVVVTPASERPLSLAPPVDDPDPQPVAAPVPPDERPGPAAKLQAAVESSKPAPVEPDGPPAIEPPATEPAVREEPRSTPVQTQAAIDRDAGGDPTLAGRPRLTQVEPIRDHVPPDLPAVSFPRSYYTAGEIETVKATARPKIDPETRPARWTWSPKLFRRLRGEAPTDPKSETVRYRM